MNKRTSVFLSVQRAFLGEITADIRAIAVSYLDSIQVTVYFEGSISESRLEDLSCVETEIMCDFPDDKVQLKVISNTNSSPLKIAGELVYSRKE